MSAFLMYSLIPTLPSLWFQVFQIDLLANFCSLLLKLPPLSVLFTYFLASSPAFLSLVLFYLLTAICSQLLFPAPTVVTVLCVCLIVFSLFRDRVLMYCPDWHRIYCADQVGLELLAVLLPPSPSVRPWSWCLMIVPILTPESIFLH